MHRNCEMCSGHGNIGTRSCPKCHGKGQIEIIEQRMTCGCCNGTGQYAPLFGPIEPCGTCKGEKTVPVIQADQRFQAEERLLQQQSHVVKVNRPDTKIMAVDVETQVLGEMVWFTKPIKGGSELMQEYIRKQLRANLHRRPPVRLVDRNNNPMSLHYAVEEAFETGAITYGASILLSQLPENDQPQYLDSAIMACSLFKRIDEAVNLRKKRAIANDYKDGSGNGSK